MRRKLGGLAVALCCAMPAVSQQPAPTSRSVPIYRVTVTERTVKAINYQYRGMPTKIDFRGTVLLSAAKGKATVESRKGRTEIDADFENLLPPSRFGHEYLTYVLWAVTPEGSARNIGEIVPNASNKASLRVTTDLQAFGMIVTAEPYSAAREPSDVVVMENEVRPDTVGKVQEIQAKYELMPRGHYTWQVPENPHGVADNAPKVSMKEYEALLHLYQAQNAVGIAGAANAEQYAPQTFAKAQQLLEEARRLQSAKAGTSLVVQNAREAAQTAEDARLIAVRRQQQEKVTEAQKEVVEAREAQARAQAEAQRARSEAETARARADAERIARERAEAQASQDAQASRSQTADRVAPPEAPDTSAGQKSQLRMQLLERLNGAAATRDTPRGLVVTIPDAGFSGTALRGTVADQVARVAAAVSAYPGLRVEVEGHTDSPAGEAEAWSRAAAVRSVLMARGLGAAVTAKAMGESRPLVANTTPAGRQQNRRVEIVIAGDPIGNLPFWDRTYSLTLRSK